MKTNRFALSAGQSHTLEMAMNRPENGDWSPELVHKLCQGDNLGFVRDLLVTGRRKIIVPTEMISWKEEDNIIYLSVVSDGRDADEWISTCDVLDIDVSTHGALDLLRDRDFQSTSGVRYGIAIIKCDYFNKKFAEQFEKNPRIYYKFESVMDECEKRGWRQLHPEVMCLLGEALPRHMLKKMGLSWIRGVHKPLCQDASRYQKGKIITISRQYGLTAVEFNSPLLQNMGFAFEVSRSVVKGKK